MGACFSTLSSAEPADSSTGTLKKEILPQTPARSDLEESRAASKAAVLRHAGLLADLTPEEEQRFLEAVRRRPLFGGRRVWKMQIF